ncbi:MAG TPA: hypothetical protein VFA22_09315 [Stellaceae bacterium]|nr:hypothetical protein [Stellaceae bacterium]
MDRAAQLVEVLGKLSALEAVALARAVELARLKGRETLPTELVLDALRPRLREARAGRIPNLRRLVCAAFQYFLIDEEELPRVPGRLPRAAIAPWWTALQRIGGAELRALEAELAGRFTEGASGDTQDVALAAWSKAAEWTRSLSQELAAPKRDAALRELFPRVELGADVAAIADLLAIAAPVTAAFAAMDQVLAAAGKLDGRQIVEFIPEAVTIAKQHYVAMSEAQGMRNSLLALGLLNRLRRPWHILRLARALSWKQNDALLRQTEFAVVGERLIQGLAKSAQDIAALAAPRTGAIDAARIAAAIADYMEEAEGLLGEFGFRRDSDWGEAILRTRVSVSDAIGRAFLGRLAEQMMARILPVERRAGTPRGVSAEPDLREPPSDGAIAEAIEAAKLLAMLQHRGARHGFGQPAHDTIDALGTEIEKRTRDLLDALRRSPGHPVIEAQISAAAHVIDVLFEDGRGSTIARRMRLLRPAPA